MVKSIIKSLIPQNAKRRITLYLTQRSNFPQLSTLQFARKFKIAHPNPNKNFIINYAEQAERVFDRIKVNYCQHYIYPYYPLSHRLLPPNQSVLASMTVDFGKILDSNLSEIKSAVENLEDSEFRTSELMMIETITNLNHRISENLKKSTSARAKQLAIYFQSILYRKPESLDEAIQKILFYNALFWQMNHWHIGLGRLDKILYPYYANDLQNGKISRDDAKKMLIHFCDILHNNVENKSLSLKGDTGQYILLGGQTSDVECVENDITELFLQIFKEHPYADPKLILRVNSHTSDKIWDMAIASIAAGSGSPLIMNEIEVMSRMKDFGYSSDDLTEVGTSACWEPLIIGKSFDQNNPFPNINALAVLNDLISGKENFEDFNTFKQKYFDRLRRRITSIIPSKKEFDVSPLFSLFYDDCINRQKDFTLGGAVYSYHGAQMIGLPNVVNSLVNIHNLIFEKKILSFDKLRIALENNFEGFEDIHILLTSGENKFGSSAPLTLSLTNEIMAVASEAVEGLTCNGEKIKIGFSSPSYIWNGKRVKASPDGRKAGEPLAVHISPISSDIDIAEILDFATKLNYSGNRINGNVVDFIVPHSFIQNPDKLRALLKDACARGLFELQLNVLDKATLIDAKAHPEKYPNLIVRVWGFSAYFNDLPESYKDNLIERASIYDAN